MQSQNLDNFKNFVFTMHYLNEPAISTTKAVIISLTVLGSVLLVGFISYRCFMKFYGRSKYSNQPLTEPLLKEDKQLEEKTSSEVRYEPQETRKSSEIVRKVTEPHPNVSEQVRRESASPATPVGPKKSSAQYSDVNNPVSDTKEQQSPSQQPAQQVYPEVNNPFTLTDEEEQT